MLTPIQLPASVKKYVGNQTLKTIGIAPFAAYEGKMYPYPLMNKVLGLLNDTNKYKILLFGGGPKEKDYLMGIESAFSQCKNIAGELPFEDELCLISNLDLMLSMDSGNGHLSAMFGVPTLTIWGITHPFAGFAPFGQHPELSILADREQYPMIPTSVYGNKYPKGYENVMQSIDPKDVVRKIETLLN